MSDTKEKKEGFFEKLGEELHEKHEQHERARAERREEREEERQEKREEREEEHAMAKKAGIDDKEERERLAEAEQADAGMQ